MMNKVPEDVKKEYLRKNPAMLAAWKACGYDASEKTTTH